MPEIDHYVVQLRNDANTSTLQTQTVDAATFTATFTGLEPETAYKVRIYAQAAGILSATPKVVSITTLEGEGGSPTLLPPTDASVSRGSGSIVLAGVTDDPDGIVPDEYFVLPMNDTFTSTIGAPQTAVRGSGFPLTFTGLSDATAYGLRILSKKAAAYSATPLDYVVSASGAPPAPTSVTAATMPDGQVILSWDEMAGATLYRYIVHEDATTTTGTTTDFALITGSAGHDYYIEVRSENSSGNSSYVSSNTVTSAVEEDGGGGSGGELVYRGGDSVNGLSGTSSTLTWPAGVQSGDVALVAVSAYAGLPYDAPASIGTGWTAIGYSKGTEGTYPEAIRLFSHDCDGTESGPLTVEVPSSNMDVYVASVRVYSSATVGTPSTGSGGALGGGSCPAGSTVVEYAASSSGTVTAPGALSHTMTKSPSSNNLGQASGDEVVSDTAIPSRTATAVPAAGEVCSVPTLTVVLTP